MARRRVVVTEDCIAVADEIVVMLRLVLAEQRNQEITEHERRNSTRALLTRARRLCGQLCSDLHLGTP